LAPITGPLFVDTGAWYAYVNEKDPDHEWIAESIETATTPLVTSNYVFDETITLTAKRLGHRTATEVGKILRDPSVVEIKRIERKDEEAAWDLFQERDDKEYSYTDCTSFVLMNRLGIENVATTDGDFEIEGFRPLP